MEPIDKKATQKALGLTPDGIFGRGTYTALFNLVASPDADKAVIASLANAATVHFPEYGIDASRLRLTDIISQCANETGDFRRFEENLNYSVDGLINGFSRKRISIADAQRLGRKPGESALSRDRQMQIANIIYGGEWGRINLGNILPTDGWDRRGMGMLQMTGRANFERADKRLGIGLDIRPDLATVPAISLLIACDFYRAHKVLDALDRGDTVEARRITNGADKGLAEVNRNRSILLARVK